MSKLDNSFVDISGFERLIISGDDALANVCDELQQREILSADSETTGLDPKRSRLSLVQIADLASRKTFIIDYFTIKNPAPLAALMAKKKLLILCHTGNFDSEFFIHNFGQYIETPIDLFQGGLLLRRYMDRPISDFKLKLMLERYCGIEISKEMQTSDWGRRPLIDDQIEYAALDVETLYPLGVAISEEIDREGMYEAWVVESLLQMVTAQLRYNGIFVDAEELRPLGAEIRRKIIRADELISAYPELRADVTDIFTMLEGGYNTINLDSPIQLRKALESRWKCAVPSTKASEIKKFWAKDPELVELLSERASLKSMLANHVEGILNTIDSITGRVHSDFLQNASPQHRPKSSKPILLNIPKKSKYGPDVLNKESLGYSKRNFRDCFKPAPGCVFVKADYSGLQLRAIAQESGDPVMCAAFQNGDDLHALTSSFIFDIPTTKVGQAQRDLGKAQPLDAKILTPDGWTLMGNLEVGNCVIGSDGRETRVDGTYFQGLRPVYKITLSDRSVIRCDKEHLLTVRLAKTFETLSVEQIINKTTANPKTRYYLPIIRPVEFSPSKLPIDPYVIGAMIGDGSFGTGVYLACSTDDESLAKEVSQRMPIGTALVKVSPTGPNVDRWSVRSSGTYKNPTSFLNLLRSLGLHKKHSHEKFIPEAYKFAAIEDRTALLQGLMDTDGTCHYSGRSLRFRTTSYQLALDFQELIELLGGTARLNQDNQAIYIYRGEVRQKRQSYTIYIKLPPEIKPFRLPRKARLYNGEARKPPARSIMSIEYEGEKLCRCIRIANTNGLYATDHAALVHNTSNFAISFMCSAETLQRTFLKDLGVRKTLQECEMFIKRFLKRYRGVAAYHKYQPQRAKREGRISVRGGRATLLKPGADPSTEAVNFVCALIEQSGIKKALARLGRIFWKMAKASGKICRIVLSVFDEILVECDPGLADEVKEILSREMVRAMEDYIWKIPVKAEAKICSTWGGRAIGEIAVFDDEGDEVSRQPIVVVRQPEPDMEVAAIAAASKAKIRKIILRPEEA